MTLILLFCFCCHHCYLVMSIFDVWQLIIWRRCVLPIALPNEDYCSRSTVHVAVRHLQASGINEFWGDFYCSEQNIAKLLVVWIPGCLINLSFVQPVNVGSWSSHIRLALKGLTDIDPNISTSYPEISQSRTFSPLLVR